MFYRFALHVLMMGLVLPVAAQDTETSETIPSPTAGFPRYASLKKGEVNVRSGPGNQYPVLWVYQRAGYPVVLLARYDNYYKVRDVEAEEGWVYIGMVSPKKTALVSEEHKKTESNNDAESVPAILMRKHGQAETVMARLSPGVVVTLEEPCSGDLCRVEVEGAGSGWIEKRRLLMVEPAGN